MTPPPATLDRAGLAALVPHRGTMLLLDRLERWDASRIRCRASDHRDPAHPLRSAGGLLAPAAIEMAAQAMALHGALTAMADGRRASPGYLASVRGVEFARWRLDDLGAEALLVEAERQAGDAERILYAFTVTHGSSPALAIARGRAAVVLNTPIAA
jgi:predicted hotdog family 3-hydroxylacyl-ACP dehydratase